MPVHVKSSRGTHEGHIKVRTAATQAIRAGDFTGVWRVRFNKAVGTMTLRQNSSKDRHFEGEITLAGEDVLTACWVMLTSQWLFDVSVSSCYGHPMTAAKHRLRKARATGSGATVNKAGTIRVGKIGPKGEIQITHEEKLLRADAARLSKMLEGKWGASAAAPVAVSGAPAAAPAKNAGNVRDTSRRKATTFRLDPALQARLALLGQVLKTPLNRLVNEAVRGFIEKRSAEVEADLERTLERLKAGREKDPRFESAIAQFVEAEASLGRDDPMEGGPRPLTGPAQTMVHELLRG